MKIYKAEVLATKGIKETYLIFTDTIGDAEDKAFELFKMRHPKKSIMHDIIEMNVAPMIIHGILH